MPRVIIEKPPPDDSSIHDFVRERVIAEAPETKKNGHGHTDYCPPSPEREAPTSAAQADGVADAWWDARETALHEACLQAIKDVKTNLVKLDDKTTDREFTRQEEIAFARFVGLVTGGNSSFKMTNFRLKEVDVDGKKEFLKHGLSLWQLTERLLACTNGGPMRMGNLLFAVEDEYKVWPAPDVVMVDEINPTTTKMEYVQKVRSKVCWLPKTEDLMAWLGRQFNAPIRWIGGEDKVTHAIFHAHLSHVVREYRAVEEHPHEPPLDDVLYVHQPIEGGDGSALNALLDRFNPATSVDRSLLLAAFLTVLWGGPPGARPAFLIEATDDDGQCGRGVGKSTVAKAVARLVGGHIDFRPSDNFENILKRLLTPESLTKRVALLDNIKTLNMSWSDLEALITNDVISGHRMYKGDASRLNLLTWFITSNNATMSKDLAQRSIIIRVKRPTYTGDWERNTWDFIDRHRQEIIGNAIALLSSPEEKWTVAVIDGKVVWSSSPGGKLQATRWGTWELEVLSKVPDAEECQKVILERREVVDADQEDTDLVRAAFAQVIHAGGRDPDKATVFFASPDAAKIVNAVKGEKLPTNKASARLGTLGIAELRKSKRDGYPGWRWAGKDAPDGQAAIELSSLGDIIVGLFGQINRATAEKEGG